MPFYFRVCCWCCEFVTTRDGVTRDVGDRRRIHSVHSLAFSYNILRDDEKEEYFRSV